jgi:hypothetical protein
MNLRQLVYHGDPGNRARILVYYDFGWSLYEDLTETCFTEVKVCVYYNIFSGFVSNSHPCINESSEDGRFGNMLPVVFVCKK